MACRGGQRLRIQRHFIAQPAGEVDEPPRRGGRGCGLSDTLSPNRRALQKGLAGGSGWGFSITSSPPEFPDDGGQPGQQLFRRQRLRIERHFAAGLGRPASAEGRIRPVGRAAGHRSAAAGIPGSRRGEQPVPPPGSRGRSGIRSEESTASAAASTGVKISSRRARGRARRGAGGRRSGFLRAGWESSRCPSSWLEIGPEGISRYFGHGLVPPEICRPKPDWDMRYLSRSFR